MKYFIKTVTTSLFFMTMFTATLRFNPAEAKVINCANHRIYCQIKRNVPNMNDKKAMKLSNLIHKVSIENNISARIYTAILMQESRYNLQAKGCHKGLYQENTPEQARDLCHTFDVKKFSSCFREKTKFIEKKICTDFGISQIYYKTAKGFNFDLERLTDDLEYSIKAGAIVLANMKNKYRKGDVNWWTRYNCGTKGSTNRDTCVVYKNLVKRYF